MKVLLIATISSITSLLGGYRQRGIELLGTRNKEQQVTEKHISFSGTQRPTERETLGLQTPYSGEIYIQSSHLSGMEASQHQLVISIQTQPDQTLEMQATLSIFGEHLFVRLDSLNSTGTLSPALHALLLLLREYLETNIKIDTLAGEKILWDLIQSSQAQKGIRLESVHYEINTETIISKTHQKIPSLPPRYLTLS
ncbi:MAG: hypothetical protein H6765_10315 [Candidatus Peribacteria bacterium]|nr:MAG: hypothetical protein H6765_10315 [Candidatus Peribacteria bacterium]